MTPPKACLMLRKKTQEKNSGKKLRKKTQEEEA
jgi:hypothetical protein